MTNTQTAPECIRVKTVCDLSRGVEVDDQTYRIAIHLRSPDPDFLYKLTEPFFATPFGDPGVPATTPVAAQPPGYPDKIEWTLETDPDSALRSVLAGDADADQWAPDAAEYTTTTLGERSAIRRCILTRCVSRPKVLSCHSSELSSMRQRIQASLALLESGLLSARDMAVAGGAAVTGGAS